MQRHRLASFFASDNLKGSILARYSFATAEFTFSFLEPFLTHMAKLRSCSSSEDDKSERVMVLKEERLGAKRLVFSSALPGLTAVRPVRGVFVSFFNTEAR